MNLLSHEIINSVTTLYQKCNTFSCEGKVSRTTLSDNNSTIREEAVNFIMRFRQPYDIRVDWEWRYPNYCAKYSLYTKNEKYIISISRPLVETREEAWINLNDALGRAERASHEAASFIPNFIRNESRYFDGVKDNVSEEIISGTACYRLCFHNGYAGSWTLWVNKTTFGIVKTQKQQAFPTTALERYIGSSPEPSLFCMITNTTTTEYNNIIFNEPISC